MSLSSIKGGKMLKRWKEWCGGGVLAVLAFSQMAALRTAAGGTSGTNGFADLSRFLDNLATYAIWLAVPLGVLGLVIAGGMLIVGDQNGSSMLGKVAIGVGIVLLSKGILA